MIVIDAEQGSPEWHQARAGKVTASRIGDIMRRTKTGVSAMRATYIGELVAERLSGHVSTDGYVSAAMQHGIDTEDSARAFYEFERGASLARVGFVLHPKIEMSGASPDQLVNHDGLIEVKCPQSKQHIATLRGEPIADDYVKQMQWQLACTGRAWCDFVSFDPRLPPEMQMFVRRFERDDKMIAEITVAVVSVLAEVDAIVADLRSQFRMAA